MANRTDKEAYSIHGTNPQNLVEYIIRQKVYQTTYWKESCFALTAETVVERAAELRAAGGTYGGARKPTNFMCLILKMLQIQPDKEIIIEYIKSGDFKYVRLLGAFYMRLVGRPQEVYQYLEPLYNDYRKVRVMTIEGQYILRHMDEVVDDMLNKDHMFDIAMPRLPARWALEKLGTLEPRVSVLDEEFDEGAVAREAEAEAARQQAAQIEYAGLAEGAGGERHRDHSEGEERDGHEAGNGHARSYDDDRRRDSPDRKKEKWQLSKDERREQARRRSPSRSPGRSASRSPVRVGGREDRDRRERDVGPSTGRDERDRRRDDRGGDRRRDEREREEPRDRRRDEREEPRERRRDDADYDKARERRRSRSRSRERGREQRDKRRSRSPDRKAERTERDREKPSTKDKDKGAGASGKPRAVDPNDREIAEANAVRASLGLAPLK